MEVKPVVLVLVDISGYTRFITQHIATVLHAEAIITDLLETVIDKSEYPLTLSKLEGDAAFLYAPLDRAERDTAQGILKQVVVFVEAFRARERDLVACVTCSCEACQTIDRLRLKAILHSGHAVIKKVHQIEELGGEDPILIHRLLKNTIPVGEYILMTDAFYKLSGGLAGYTPESRTEACEGIGEVTVQVYYPPEPGPATPSPQSELDAREDAFMKQVDKHLVSRVLGRAPRRQFAHLKMQFSPRAVWEFFLGSIAHVGDIIRVMKTKDDAGRANNT